MAFHVSIIGSGNLAWHLAIGLEQKGFHVAEIYARNPKKANELAQRLYNPEIKQDLNFTDSPSTLFFIAVADNAISTIAETLAVPEGSIVAHTSGSSPIHLLEPIWDCTPAVFYPLQTFTKGKPLEWKNIPICLECHDETALETLAELAAAFSENIIHINSEQRQKLHLAAVFASNFANHLWNIANTLLEDQNLGIEFLKPLIEEQIKKTLEIGPFAAQTGPAKRNDTNIIQLHRNLLDEYPKAAELYEIFTEQITELFQVTE